MKHPTRRATVGAGLNSQMTPMVDVVFQLLIFFLLTAGFQRPEGLLRTNLPPTGAPTKVPRKEEAKWEIVRVSLKGDANAQTLSLNDKPIPDRATLSQNLRGIAEVSREVPVVLEVEPTVPIATVVDIYDDCLSTGLRKVHFAAHK